MKLGVSVFLGWASLTGLGNLVGPLIQGLHWIMDGVAFVLIFMGINWAEPGAFYYYLGALGYGALFGLGFAWMERDLKPPMLRQPEQQEVSDE